MLTAEDNELLTRTGPGTPMGNLFRRFWLPALLPSELPEPDAPPVRLRLLSEDLIAFRDTRGRVGFVTQACPHRGASLFFGRNEESGLRCVYHGWKFDVSGACVDMPSEPAESNFRSKVRVAAYPSAEQGGIVWVYMGPAEKRPPLPQYGFCLRPPTPEDKIFKWMQESNYAQGLEGNIDTAHISFLHRGFGNRSSRRYNPDVGPTLQLRETEFGFAYGGRRDTADGRYYWRITPFVLPTFTSIPSQWWNGSGIFVLPMDDEHSWWWSIQPGRNPDAPVQPAMERPRGLVPYVELVPGTWRQTRNRDNDYLIDREMQRSFNYTGLPGNRVQDAAVTESMGAIYDRSREHLGTSDRAIIFMRRYLIRLARQLEQGIEPEVLGDGARFRVRPVDIVTAEPDLEPLWQADHAAHLAEEPLPAPLVP
jgi:nitrite reductase/ring-hydroxylating ferredoxin subunit